jgi:gamma-glutamyl hercynylcysteine S-oxide synthase
MLDSSQSSINDKAWLAQALQNTRRNCLAVYANLSEADRAFPKAQHLNLPIWEMGHIAWFQEWWCQRYPATGERGSILPDADRIYDSRYVSHADRWSLRYPSWSDTLAYLATSLSNTLQALNDAPPSQLYFFQLCLHHEEMHREALLMSLHNLRLPYTKPNQQFKACKLDWIEFAGLTCAAGCEPSEVRNRFVWDNEKWTHAIHLSHFALANRLVNQAEFALFDASYEVDEPEAPVLNISALQADAYAAWAGFRLATEHEWATAVAQRPEAFPDAFGVAWQWTSSVFQAFPGFAADPYAEYSAPWFDGQHRVLKGSSWASSPLLNDTGFRNFYTPDRSDVFAGIRLARS